MNENGNVMMESTRKVRNFTPSKWSTLPPPPHRTTARNIVNIIPDPKVLAREASTSEESFDLFFNDRAPVLL